MALTSTERGRRYRERHHGEPLGNKPMRAQLAALKQERDKLAERLAAIEADQPGITEKAKAWVAEVDRQRRR